MEPEVVLRKGRCAGCRLPTPACLCAELPQIETTTRLVVVIHWRELVRLSNSGHLLPRILPRATMRVRGHPGGDLVALPDTPAHRRLLLYCPPAEDDAPRSHAVAELSAAHRPRKGEELTLLVPDGSWTQTRRMVRREPIFAHSEMVTLPRGAPSRYRLRHPKGPGMLSTFEAVARALALLEDDPSIATRMEAFFSRWVGGMVAARGS